MRIYSRNQLFPNRVEIILNEINGMKKRPHWVYILLCENNTYYTGYTNNLVKRYQSHLNGTGKCKYTLSFKPLCIAQCWRISDKSLAMKIEQYIKKLTRTEKEKIIAKPLILSTDVRIKTITKKELLSLSIPQ